jgi:hypothetical protein
LCDGTVIESVVPVYTAGFKIQKCHVSLNKIYSQNAITLKWSSAENGLVRKLADLDFISVLNRYDVIILSEVGPPWPSG